MDDKKEVSRIYFTTDILIFSVSDTSIDDLRKTSKKKFSILLVKRLKEPFKDMWCIPGGYVGIDETLDSATDRILEKETKLKKVYKEQLYTFDALDRDPRGRTVSTSYMALIDKNKLNNDLDINTDWFDITYNESKSKFVITLQSENSSDYFRATFEKKNWDKTTSKYKYSLSETSSPIAFDHFEIILEGILRLRKKTSDTDIVFNLMPKEFTLGELQRVYEAILNKKLLDPAFRRIIADKVVKTNKYIKTGGHRPSVLYKLK